MTISTDSSSRVAFFDAVSAKLRAASRWIDSNTVRGRAIRNAERMMRKSDTELAQLGLTRDNILQHAFSRYVAC